MPPPPTQHPGMQEPTIWSKLKMGATMGSLVGLSIGFIFGSFAILRNGAGPRGFLPSLSGYMLTSAATFGFFMSIGTVIRTDSLTLPEWSALQLEQQRRASQSLASNTAMSSSNKAIMREWERRRLEGLKGPE